MIVKPFKAYRPKEGLEDKINVPPYDVVSRNDVLKSIENNPYSFFYITRSDVFFDEEYEHDLRVYNKARENLERFIKEQKLVQDDKPCFYICKQIWNNRTQTGIYSLVSCEEYENKKIKKHELTRVDKENDRTNHIEITGADTGPVFLIFKDKQEEFKKIINDFITTHSPLYNITDENKVNTIIYKIDDDTIINKLINLFNEINSFYIADGHHRAASAYNVWKKNNKAELYKYFMSVIFPANDLLILPYNRAVKDLNNLSVETFIERIKAHFDVYSDNNLEVLSKGSFKIYIDGKFYKLVFKNYSLLKNDIEKLDVSILQDYILRPILNIDDPRTSDRIFFIGGVKDGKYLKNLVDENKAKIVFSLYPVDINDLMKISDSDNIMPPKSTWFEPKLRDGLLIYKFK